MYCRNCGSTIKEEESFCSNCYLPNNWQSDINQQNDFGGEILFDKVTTISRKIKKIIISLITIIILSAIPILLVDIFILGRTTEEMIGNLIIKIPQTFEEGWLRNDNYLNYELSDYDNDCEIKIQTVPRTRFDTEQEYLDFITGNSNKGQIENRKIKNKSWTYFKEDYSYSIYHNYLIADNQYFYHVEFIIDEDDGLCSKHHKKIIKSLNLK